MKRRLATLIFIFAAGTVFAADATPQRIYFSDAGLSFTFPPGGELDDHFPMAPLFHLSMDNAKPALIFCRASKPFSPMHIAADIPMDELSRLAIDSLQSQFGMVIDSKEEDSFSEHHALRVLSHTAEGHCALTEFFFKDGRLYALSLEAPTDAIEIYRPLFENWLKQVSLVGPAENDALLQPSHGGLWIHQSGGLRIKVPTAWLIGVSNARTLGMTISQDDQHSELTATVDILNTAKEILPNEKTDAEQALEKKGYRLLSESDEPFHGLAALRLEYDGQKGARYIRGEDIWVASAKGRWLFSMEGDGVFFRGLMADYVTLLNDMDFF